MSNKLPSDVQRTVKSTIERMSCPVHHEHPNVSFTSQGFSISCCCDEFKEHINSQAEKIVADAMEKHIETYFKKHLK